MRSVGRVGRVDRSGSRSIDRVGSSIDRGRDRSIGSVHRSIGVALDRSGRFIDRSGSRSIDRVDRSRRVALDRVGPSSIAANLREGLVVESRPDGTPRARCVLSRNVAWVIPFGIVGIRHDRLDGPMDEIPPPRARGRSRRPSRDISRRATARGRDGDARLGWTAIESREFHASRRRGRERGGGRERRTRVN